MRGKLVDYGSSDDDSDNESQQNQKQEKKEIQKPNQKRTINYSQLATLRPFKQQKIDDNDNQKNQKDDQEEDEDDWKPQTQEEQKKQQEEKGNTETNQKKQPTGISFKLSRPEKELRNLGEEQLTRIKNNEGSIKSYDQQVRDQQKHEQNLNRLPQFQNSGISMQKKVLGKMTEILGKELNDDEKRHIEAHDVHDNMFIDRDIQDKADRIYQNMENQEQGYGQYQEEQEEEYDEQPDEEQEENFKNMKEHLMNRHNKREQKFLANMVDVDGRDLTSFDWQGQQEKSATSKELMSKNSISMPQSNQAKGKNKIQFLAKSVMAEDSVQIGQYRGGSAQQRTRSRYGW